MTDEIDFISTYLIARNENTSQALAHNLGNCHVEYAIVDPNDEIEKIKICTGILISIGDKTLIATAAHCIRIKGNKQFSFVTPKMKNLTDGILEVKAEHIPVSEDLDVGIIDIENCLLFDFLNEDVEDKKQKKAVDLSRVALLQTGNPEKRSTLCGFPGVNNERDDKNKTIVFQGISYSNFVIDKSCWPDKLSFGRVPNEGIDILLPYDPTEEMWQKDNEGEFEKLPQPWGISGGGIWQDTYKEEGVWSPDCYKLYGIQSEWDKKNNISRGVQIFYWLKLVQEKYNDLSEIISSQFEELSR